MQNPHNKIERSVIKIAAWTMGIIILLIAGGVVGHRQFRNWQERRLVAQANALVNEGNLKKAGLDARRIIQINPESAEGCRIMARIAEKVGSPTAVEWRRRAADLSPGNAADWIALAQAAQRFDDAGSRDYALNRLPEGAKNTAEYHALAAELASTRRQNKEVEEHLSEAVRLDPANKEYALRLATLRFSSSDRAERETARGTLQQLVSEPTVRREALRRLTDESLRRGESEEALKTARELDALPEREFRDRLLLLSAVHASFDPGFTALLQQVQAEAVEQPERIADLLTWLNARKMPAAAIAWAAQLPETAMAHRAVPIALSDSYIAAGDWAGMQRLVKNNKWGSLEFLRNALAARAARELGDSSLADAQWGEALKNVTGDPKHALTLAEIVHRWGWRDQAVELLWVAAKDPAKGDEALQSLYQYYAKGGASADLYRVLIQRRAFRPDDLDIQNNVAQLSLLLNLNTEQGQKLARDLYEKDPKNPAYVSTYGFALHTKGDSKNALKIFETLNEQQLHQPEVAAYYGIALAGAGQHDRATEFLTLAENAELLPEERSMIEKARRTLARR